MGAVRAHKAAILEDVAVHDLFEPEGATEKNVTLRVTYRHAERTLTDKDVDKTHQGLCDALVKALPVRFQ